MKALKVRRLVKKDFDDAFEKCDVVMGPTTPTAAFAAGEKSEELRELKAQIAAMQRKIDSMG